MLNDGQTDLVITYLIQIANALDGKTETTSTQTGDRLRDALKRIATSIGASGGSLPAVEAKDNGKVLQVVNGAWALGNELPAVTTTDAGSVLKVNSEGKWVAGTIE